MPDSLTLRVATLNIHSIKDRYHRRLPLILHQAAALAPDILALQEASTLTLQARFLAWRLNRRLDLPTPYHALHRPKRGWRGLLEGPAIVTCLPITSTATLNLRGDHRIALRATLQTPSGPLDAYSIHLANQDFMGPIRLAQARRLLDWIATRPGIPAIVMGDCNDEPGSETIALLSQSLRSAHTLANGAEPNGTSPAVVPEGRTRRTIDYIFVNDLVEVRSCTTAFDHPSPRDRTLYPSDHLGLTAELSLHI